MPDSTRFGVLLPHEEVGAEPKDIQAFALAVEAAGFDYLASPEHVIGADTSSRPDWQGRYDATSIFHEPFVLFGFLAALTKLELTSAILVLPQRQTALVAKQAAEVDVLTGGRFRLGVGSGWNSVEFEALGQDFRSRGRRLEEQVELLRLLWTEPVVDFDGQFHRIDRAGIQPLPVQKPIPVWVGGGAGTLGDPGTTRVLDRIGRIADGWISGRHNDSAHIAAAFAEIRVSAERAGRDPDLLGLQVSLILTERAAVSSIGASVEALRGIGATHITLETRRGGLVLEQHVELIGAVGDALRAER